MQINQEVYFWESEKNSMNFFLKKGCIVSRRPLVDVCEVLCYNTQETINIQEHLIFSSEKEAWKWLKETAYDVHTEAVSSLSVLEDQEQNECFEKEDEYEDWLREYENEDEEEDEYFDEYFEEDFVPRE